MSQTQIIIAIAIVLIVVAAIILLRTKLTKSPYELAKESSVYQPGPIRHSELPPELIERIHRLEETFAEIYPLTHEEWLDGFKRDLDPENEITTWGNIAFAYTQFLNSGDFSADARNEAFRLLLFRSSTSDIESQLSDLRHLTEDQARSLLALYETPAQPIAIEDAE
jgi:hypothetical protein